MDRKDIEIRVPIALIKAHLPAWVKLIWIAIRGFQGRNNSAWASAETIGNEIISERGTPMKRQQVHRGIKALEEAGFLVVNGRKNITCIIPANVNQELTNGKHTLSTDSFSNVNQEFQFVNQEFQNVNQEFHIKPTIKPKIKPTRKTKGEKLSPLPAGLSSYDEVLDSWNKFASSHYLPKVKKITKTRREKIRRHAAEIWPQIEEVYSAIAVLPFYLGMEPGKNWKANFDWLWRNDENYLKVLEKASAIHTPVVKKKTGVPVPSESISTYTPPVKDDFIFDDDYTEAA